MFIGHYGPSFIARRRNPSVPLWALVLAAHLVDVFWAIFIILGIEHMRIVPGFTRSNPLDLYYQPYTHSLPAACVWALAAGLAWRLIARDARGSTLIAATVFSHWPLDLIVHPRDLPIWDDTDKVGFGLWNHPIVSLLLEAGIAVAALWVWRVANPTLPGSRLRWLPLVMVLVFAFQATMLRLPPPPSPSALAAMLLGFYVVFTAVVAWLERRPQEVIR
jgi:hypothetical protein